jgi:hypothetical protein
MKIKITYPSVNKKKLKRDFLKENLKWLMLLGAYVCPIINFFVGGKFWSAVVLLGIYTVWTMALSPDLVEYNRISQFIKGSYCSSLILGGIELFLAPGWALKVLPIVCFSTLIVSGVLFFTDFETQKQNMLPMLSLAFFALLLSALSFGIWKNETPWQYVVMFFVAISLVATVIISTKSEFITEIKRRFHIK